MFAKKKTTLGFLKKPRAKHEIQKEYTDHAVQAGHKLKLMEQWKQRLQEIKNTMTGLQTEIDQHAQELVKLSTEMTNLEETKETTE